MSQTPASRPIAPKKPATIHPIARRILYAFAFALLSPGLVLAQGLIYATPRPQQLDNNGVIAAGYKLCSYQAGSTTPLATYSDSTLMAANTNPLIANSAGRWTSSSTEVNLNLAKQSYKFILLTAGTTTDCSTGSTIWTADNVPGGYDASVIVGGTIATARLGSGSASAATFLRGDSTWASLSNVITTTTTGTQNDWAPGIVSGALNVIRSNNATDLTLTGLSATGVADGTRVRIVTLGAGNIYAKPQNTGSAAANRFTNQATSGDTPIAAGGSAEWVYDLTSTTWRLTQHEQGAWITPSFSAGNFTGNGSQTWTVEAGDVQVNRFRLVGRTLIWALSTATTSVGGTPNPALKATIAGGFTSQGRQMLTAVRVSDNSASVFSFGMAFMGAGQTFVELYKDATATANWTGSTNLTTIEYTATIEVN